MKNLIIASCIAITSMSAIADRQADLAIAGAIIGGIVDQQDPVRGAVVGGVLGAVSQNPHRDSRQQNVPQHNYNNYGNTYVYPAAPVRPYNHNYQQPRAGADYYAPHRYHHNNRVDQQRFNEQRAFEINRADHQRYLRESYR